MTVTVDKTTEPVNLIWTAGDTQNQTFRFLTAPDQPVDLTGITISSTARSTLGTTTKLIVQVTDPTNGTVTIHPPTDGLDPDVYDYDIQFADATVTQTWVHGRLQVRKDITR
jgi:hypothetical protein